MSETDTCVVLQQDVDAIFGPSSTQHTETVATSLCLCYTTRLNATQAIEALSPTMLPVL